ncbi:centrosomal protein of 120 kDa [Echinococcus multilocularis]|uniref:Centrosomal protein of 120 kDa n=1 Tax=Echinococcus multilocularis TaxID=6211 RepID=A0A068YBL6_ECHMU|nr:centrosomal protein of 120 kDa [Echinococcus multilocularis]
MTQGRRCLVVVSVISGRNFVDKPEAIVIAEAKLDRELLATDPVPHSSTPHFEQELAWEVDHANLRQYRLQRTSIKLQIFAINYNASPCSRNLLGYIILDVRSATERKTFKWFQVLNSKLRPCPEVYCGLYIDPCSSSSLVGSGDLNATPLEVERFVENFGNQLVDGFEIGGTDSPKECFLISMVLVSIPQLANLLPPEVSPSSTFKLTLRFLSNDLFIWEFKEEDCTKLGDDQYKFFIRSTVDAIRACFLRVNIIEITLFVDEKPIGHCQGNLSLIGDQITPTTRYPLSMDVTFTLISPQVGNVNSPVILRFNVNNHDVQRHINGSHSQVKAGPKTNGGGSPAQALNMDTTLVQMQTNQRSASETLPSQQPITSRTTAPQIPTNYMNESVQLRRFCYTIELKSIRACCEPSPSKETYVYAKYVYPLFGTTNPIMTLPPVQFSANEEKYFFQGYCAFELAADFSEFKSRLLEEPLNVEILGRCSDGSNGLESSLGWAVIPLGEIFPEPVIEMSNSQRRFMTGVADVKLNGKPMAQIKYSLILDDFGVYNSSTTAEITSLNQIEGLNIDGLKEVPDSTPKLPTDIRQTSEYRAALELELWKAKEEERFKNNLKLREQKMLMVFAEEWKRRETERESLCKKKMQEYQMLEDKLRAALEALMERERQLTLKEAALNAAERDLERNLEIREKDLLNDVQRKIRDAEQAISSEQQRNFHLNNELAVLREKCKGLEERLIEHHLKATTTSTTGVTADTKVGLDQAKRDEEEIRRLQFELVRLTTELTNAQSQISTMERRLDGALRGRARYKDLWTRALQEVTRLRQEAANATKQELQRREAEVEGLRREQCLLLRAGDTRAFLHHDIPARQNPADPQSLGEAASGNQEEVPLPSSVAPQKVNNPALDAQLRRLRDERECLLTSGVYYEDDVLIVDLDKEIKRLQTLISNAV